MHFISNLYTRGNSTAFLCLSEQTTNPLLSGVTSLSLQEMGKEVLALPESAAQRSEEEGRQAALQTGFRAMEKETKVPCFFVGESKIVTA